MAREVSTWDNVSSRERGHIISSYPELLQKIHSFHSHLQNATIPCRSQELLPFLSVTYFFLPPFSTSFSSILSHLILPFISWSTSQSFVPRFKDNTLQRILFSSILCTYPNQRNPFNLIVSIIVGFSTLA